MHLRSHRLNSLKGASLDVAGLGAVTADTLGKRLVTFGVYLYQSAPRPHPGGSSASGGPAEPGYLVGGPTGQGGSAHEGHPGCLLRRPPPRAQFLTEKSTWRAVFLTGACRSFSERSRTSWLRAGRWLSRYYLLPGRAHTCVQRGSRDGPHERILAEALQPRIRELGPKQHKRERNDPGYHEIRSSAWLFTVARVIILGSAAFPDPKPSQAKFLETPQLT